MFHKLWHSSRALKLNKHALSIVLSTKKIFISSFASLLHMSNEPYLLISKIHNRTCVFLEHILLYFCRHQTYEFSFKQTNYGILSLDRYIRVPLHPFPLAQITQSSKKGKRKRKIEENTKTSTAHARARLDCWRWNGWPSMEWPPRCPQPLFHPLPSRATRLLDRA